MNKNSIIEDLFISIIKQAIFYNIKFGYILADTVLNKAKCRFYSNDLKKKYIFRIKAVADYFTIQRSWQAFELGLLKSINLSNKKTHLK